jgi:hypothetical protein
VLGKGPLGVGWVLVVCAVILIALGGTFVGVGEYAASQPGLVCPRGTEVQSVQLFVNADGSVDDLECRNSRTDGTVANLLPSENAALLSPHNANQLRAIGAILLVLPLGTLLLLRYRRAIEDWIGPAVTRVERGRVVFEDAAITADAVHQRAFEKPALEKPALEKPAAGELGPRIAADALWSFGLRRDPGWRSLRRVEVLAGLIIYGLVVAVAIVSLIYYFTHPNPFIWTVK